MNDLTKWNLLYPATRQPATTKHIVSNILPQTIFIYFFFKKPSHTGCFLQITASTQTFARRCNACVYICTITQKSVRTSFLKTLFALNTRARAHTHEIFDWSLIFTPTLKSDIEKFRSSGWGLAAASLCCEVSADNGEKIYCIVLVLYLCRWCKCIMLIFFFY